ncbi:FG-GAP-like repeat-containing protein [uncultured Psychroserpens sp.]|uniref:FG-GAP-like repeat-containing protein n=1 Tax=uncultured Psychroserpens sp. TaxID=255436 RepID=UPI00260AA082|nr:FG-GAP-like repeat-containing protein [uncultured Psychroserpens sp.]
MKPLLTVLFLFLWANIEVNAQIYFEDQATARGIGFTCGTTYIGNGVSFFDYDNDGWDDLTFTTEDGQPVRFYKNVNGSFVEQTLNIPVLNYQTKSVTWVDYDNDGDKDIYITSFTDGNKLFENDGSLNFIDITVGSGLPTNNIFSYGASWGDYDKDGNLDVFISSFDPDRIVPNYLYKNNGDGTFTNVSTTAGISPSGSLSFCSAFFDFNNDGWQDIYISNDRVNNPNILYKNNGDGTFSDVSTSSGTDVTIDAMTVTIDDFNSDGWLDIYVTNGVDGNVFFRNNGDETFTDIAIASGTLLNSVCWGAVFLDAENDEDLDLYVSSSLNGASIYSSSVFYENLGNEDFLTPTDPGFFNDNRASHSNAIGDVDNDGLQDIIVSNTNDGNVNLWYNSTTTSNNWLRVKLEGTNSNRDGIGSIIEISVNNNKQYRYTLCGEGYLSQNSATEAFGLGTNTMVDYVKVTWLSGEEDYFYDVPANQLLEITEGTGSGNNGQGGLSVDEDELSLVNFYPNPIKDIITFESVEIINMITVTDVLGKEIAIYEPKLDSFELNLSSLNTGVYFLKVQSLSNKSQTYKVIKD